MMSEAYNTHGGDEKYIKITVGKEKAKNLLGKLQRGWKNDIIPLKQGRANLVSCHGGLWTFDKSNLSHFLDTGLTDG
jgi:hypothetical protein